jgi:hypothetical protein
MSGTHEHLEHAEHAGHGGHEQDPFTMRVAMTMAIIAAVLAAISLVGHRKHNETLLLNGEANQIISDVNRLRIQAAAYKVEASNIFNWYQAKRFRVELAQNSIALTDVLAPAPDAGDRRTAALKNWKDYIAKSSPKKGSVKLDSAGMPLEGDDSLPALQIKGNAERAKADHIEEEAEHKMHEAEEIKHKAEHSHHQADWLDLAHLAVELGLVLCTVAVLTKRREFWLTGIAAAVIGIGLAGYGLYLVH